LKQRHQGCVAWLGVEPTPYLLALQERARHELPVELEVVFERRDASQAWDLPNENFTIRGGVAGRMRLLLRLLGRRFRTVFLEGWGTRWLTTVGVSALACGVPLVISGDTWQAAGGGGLFGVRRRLRRLLLRRAAATLPGGSRQRTFFLTEGARHDRLVLRKMTVDVETLGRQATALASERHAIRASLGLAPDDIVAITVARLVPEKGIDLLLRSLKSTAGVRLLIVGDGPQRPNLDRLAADLGVEHRVVWSGRLCHQDVVKAYVASDFLVLASRFEPWGLVVNEAMACGLPVVVSSAVGCADDLVAATGAGLIVAAGDAASLARALSDLGGNQQLRARMAAQARVAIARWTLKEEIEAIGQALELAVAG
jgi:hypothetical protein